MQRNPQLNEKGELQHLLSIEGLPREILLQILDTAESFAGVTEREVKKVPLLRGKSVFNLFFEPSTRTRTTFEIAAKRLSADVINLNIAVSSADQGRIAARHRRQPLGDARRHLRRAPRLVGRAVPDRAPRQAARARDQRRRRPPCASDAGPARSVHHPPLQEGFLAADGGDRRRHPAFARRALADPRPHHAGRARSARDRPADPAARRRRSARRARVPRHARGPGGLRRGGDAAPAERAHARRAAAFGAGILQALRTDRRQARARQARCDRDASGADESRRRDRFDRSPTVRIR